MTGSTSHHFITCYGGRERMVVANMRLINLINLANQKNRNLKEPKKGEAWGHRGSDRGRWEGGAGVGGHHERGRYEEGAAWGGGDGDGREDGVRGSVREDEGEGRRGGDGGGGARESTREDEGAQGQRWESSPSCARMSEGGKGARVFF